MNEVISFCKKNCCPVVEIDSNKKTVKLGDENGKEGVTEWTQEQFNDFIKAVREGKFDHIIDNS